MPTKTHGLRRYKVDGCRCDECKAANAASQADLRRRRAAGEVVPQKRPAAVVSLNAPVAAESAEPGPVELGVEAEIAGLAQTETRPGLAQAALELARVMDNPRALGQKAAASKALAEILGVLHKGTDVRKSRLASVRAMSKPQSATG
jgi:hypothetical protein